MVWTRDKIGWPNQSNTTGTVEEGAGRKRAALTTSRSGPANPSQRRRPSQPAGVERTDEEVHHDAPLRLLAELRDQGKGKGKASLRKKGLGKIITV